MCVSVCWGGNEHGHRCFLFFLSFTQTCAQEFKEAMKTTGMNDHDAATLFTNVRTLCLSACMPACLPACLFARVYQSQAPRATMSSRTAILRIAAGNAYACMHTRTHIRTHARTHARVELISSLHDCARWTSTRRARSSTRSSFQRPCSSLSLAHHHNISHHITPHHSTI